MIVLGLILLLSAPTPDTARADSAFADTVLRLPEVRVDRTRQARPVRERVPTGFSTELTPGAAGRAVETLSDLLSEASGLRVTQYGGLGSFSTVSLRGAPAGQVAIYLDGTPLQSASQGTVNLADIPFAPLERVDVHRGIAPIEMGAPPGGAIQLVTRSEPEAFSVTGARGSFGTWASSTGGGVTRGPLTFLLYGGYLGSAGDFSFDDDNGTPFNAADDSVSARLNNRFDVASGLAGLTWHAPFGLRATARHHQFHRAQGVPGIGVNPALHPRLGLDRALSQVELERAARGLVPEVKARAALQQDRSRFRDTAAELRPARADRDDHFRSGTAAIESRWLGGRRVVGFTGSLSARDERAELFDALNPGANPAPSTRHGVGASIAVTLEPGNGALLLRAARRWDRIEDQIHRAPAPGASAAAPIVRQLGVPQLGARLRLPYGFELRGNWTDAQRVPDFTELFGDQGSVQGNPALLPERGENWDAGGRFDLAGSGPWRGFLELAHFQSSAENLIVYVRNSPSTVRASNVSRAEIVGEELTLRLEAPSGFAFRASGTAMHAVDRGAIRAWFDKRLPGRPDHQATASLDWRRGDLHLGLSLDYLGDNYLDPANRRPVPDRTLIGALATVPLGPVFLLTVEGRNLGDRRVSDVGGYPLPGRSVFACLAARFGPSSP